MVKVKHILWLSQEKYPLTFYHNTSMLGFTKDQLPSKIIIYGVLKEGKWSYQGVSLIFFDAVIKTLTGDHVVRQWYDLRTFIEQFGEYEANV